MNYPWDGYIPQETLDHYSDAGFFKPTSMGTRPALLVIDVQYSTTGEKPMPLKEAIAYHPMNCGIDAWKAIDHIKPLIAAFRQAGFPVIYPHVAPRYRGSESRMPNSYSDPKFLEIVKEVAPAEGDILLPKTAPSAFFGTPLVKYLLDRKIDTVFLTGNTTSGCIRATAIDGMSYGYNIVVPHEGCYDRAPVSHAVNLFDMAAKYAEVLSTEEALGLVRSFKSPKAPGAAG